MVGTFRIVIDLIFNWKRKPMQKNRFIFYGWFIVAVGIVSYTVGYGSRYSFSVIFPSLLDEFQWPRDMTAVMLSIHLLVYGLCSPMAGSLVDRMGPRRTMILGTMVLSLGLGLSALGNEPWHFYLSFGVLTGAGLCFIGAVPFTAVLRNWFERKRGLAFSILFLGAGGPFACYPGIAFLIEHVNWRNTFLVEAIVVSGLMLPLTILLIRYHPRDKGLHVDGDSGAEETSLNRVAEARLVRDRTWAATDWTLVKAFKTARFWMLCLSTFSLWGVMQHILVAHHIAFAMDIGYSRTYASGVMTLFGAFFALGSFVALVSDRIGRESTMTIGTVIGISGIVMLLFMKDTTRPWMLYYYAVAFGLGIGMTSPTIAASVTDIFQGPKVGVIIGFVWFSFALGGSIGPWLGGWIFELTKNYETAFIVAITVYALGCAALWGAAPRKVRLVAGRANSKA